VRHLQPRITTHRLARGDFLDVADVRGQLAAARDVWERTLQQSSGRRQV